MPDNDPLFWPIARLTDAYAAGDLSPVEVARDAFDRIEAFDPLLHSYLSLSPTLAMEQAQHAERRYRETDTPQAPLLGVPLSIKDLFDVRGETTTLGSRAYGQDAAETDSTPVRLLRDAGSVFLGKSNTAEFGQSATTGNLLGPDCGNPWDPSRTSGGSSGGAAASVGAGLATAALGSDGGGSIRIPAALCGLFGIKPTFTGTPEHDSFHAMTRFVCTGPLTRSVDDARTVLGVLLERSFPRGPQRKMRIGWCASPLDRPVDPGVREVTAAAVALLPGLGHEVDEISLPIEGWADAFGPLVLADEWTYRRHLLEEARDQLTTYVRKGIEAGASVTEADVARALEIKQDVTRRVQSLFDTYDLVITPTTACVAFPIDERPTLIDGKKVDPLWGPFPFTAPFNVSGSPGASLPVGLVDGIPVGLQVVGGHDREDVILDLCEQLEAAVGFPGQQMVDRWSLPAHEGVH